MLMLRIQRKSVMQIILTPAISVRILQEMIHRKDFVLYRSRKVWMEMHIY